MFKALLNCLSISFIGLLLGEIALASTLGDEWTLVGSTVFPLPFNGAVMEGLTNDGKDFIVSTKNDIFAMPDDLSEIKYSLLNAIPEYLQKLGYNHLGDSTYYNEFIFFPVEEPTYTKPAIFVYEILNSSSIVFSTYKAQSCQAHMPWTAIDESTKILYSSEFSNVETLRMYSLDDDLKYVGDLEIDMKLDAVQGGAFYQGLLYLGVNHDDTIYSINITSGNVNAAMVQQRDKTAYEFEGITFLDLTEKGKGVMHNTGNRLTVQRMHHAEKK